MASCEVFEETEIISNGDIYTQSDYNTSVNSQPPEGVIKKILTNVEKTESDLQNKIKLIKEWLNMHENAYSQTLLAKHMLLNYDKTNKTNKNTINKNLDYFEELLKKIEINDKKYRSKKCLNELNKLEIKNKKLINLLNNEKDININLNKKNKELKNKINNLNENILNTKLSIQSNNDILNIKNGKLLNDIEILNKKIKQFNKMDKDHHKIVIAYSNNKKDLTKKINILNTKNDELMKKINDFENLLILKDSDINTLNEKNDELNEKNKEIEIDLMNETEINKDLNNEITVLNDAINQLKNENNKILNNYTTSNENIRTKLSKYNAYLKEYLSKLQVFRYSLDNVKFEKLKKNTPDLNDYHCCTKSNSILIQIISTLQELLNQNNNNNNNDNNDNNIENNDKIYQLIKEIFKIGLELLYDKAKMIKHQNDNIIRTILILNNENDFNKKKKHKNVKKDKKMKKKLFKREK